MLTGEFVGLILDETHDHKYHWLTVSYKIKGSNMMPYNMSLLFNKSDGKFNAAGTVTGCPNMKIDTFKFTAEYLLEYAKLAEMTYDEAVDYIKSRHAILTNT